ncbi:1-acyl-sn-glycerol-3-phosphate acyltransferase, partial [Thermodesulfobacteriota bacterium]
IMLAGKLKNIATIDDFQINVVSYLFNWVLTHSIDGLTCSGIKELSPDQNYILISNHRDIVLDSAFINYFLFHNKHKVAYIAFGDNLLINESVSDLIRMNKAFIVKRGLPPKEQLKALKHLSEYMNHMRHRCQNLWIAQREGRAKDGIDVTNPAIIKMLYLSERKKGFDFSEFIESCSIVPVAISYEKDPCDRIKGWEIYRTLKNGEYRKRKNEDFISMSAGISGDKGRVHVAFGKPLAGDYSDDKEVAEAIDRSIYSNYRLWPSNYIAYDTFFEVDKYQSKYTVDEKTDFLSRYKNLNPDVRKIVLNAYANPVINSKLRFN